MNIQDNESVRCRRSDGRRARDSRFGARTALVVALAGILVVGSVLLIGAIAKAAPPPAAPPAGKPVDAEAVLSSATAQFYSGDFAKAAQTVAPLADWPESYVRIPALHLAARSLMGGNKQGKEKAIAIWKGFEKTWAAKGAGADPIKDQLGRRLQIGQAIQLDADGKSAEAIAKLEPFLKVSNRQTDPAIMEACLCLAELYGKATKFDDGEVAIKFAEEYLKYQTGASGELTKSMAAVYSGQIPKVRKQLEEAKAEFLNPGRGEFGEAEKLRAAKKWDDALKLYRDIISKHPDSIYADNSGYCIGLCELGRERIADAARQWEKFVSIKPAGPFRGHALTGILDVCLQDLLDLPTAARFADLARTALPTALADEKAGDSWKPIQFEVQLRIGLVALCQAKGDIAAEAFTAARKLAPNKLTAEGIDALIAAAKTGKPVIPDDCQAKADAGVPAPTDGTVPPAKRVPLALSMGVIYTCAGKLDKAQLYFDRVLGVEREKAAVATPTPAKPAGPEVAKPAGGKPESSAKPVAPARHPMLGSTPAQLAFAIFGDGAVLQASNKPDEAKEAFLESIKAYKDGTWQDESLYRLATIIQAQAEAKSPSPAGGGSKGEGPVAAKSKDQLDKEAKAEKERIAARLLVRGDATPYWEEILKRWLVKGEDNKRVAKSPRCEDALYNIGVQQNDLADAGVDATGKPIPAEKLDQAWKDAAATLAQFCELYPKSLYAGDAYRRQVDVALERMFDLRQAENVSDAAAKWITAWEYPSAVTKPADGRAWQSPVADPDAEKVKFCVYDLRLRGVFTAYLSEKFDKAKQLLTAAGPLAPSDGPATPEKVRKIGLFFLQKAIVAEKPIWKPEVIAAAKTDPQRTAIKLAELYLKSLRPAKAAAIYERLMGGDPVFAPLNPTLAAYGTIELARTYEYDQKKHEKALEMLQTLYRPEFAQETLVAEGIVWLGTMTFNFTQDPKKAMPHFTYVITHFPNSPWAERAFYYYCLNAIAAKDKQVAEAACKDFIVKYPTSNWAKNVQSLLENQVSKLADATKGDKK